MVYIQQKLLLSWDLLMKLEIQSVVYVQSFLLMCLTQTGQKMVEVPFYSDYPRIQKTGNHRRNYYLSSHFHH
ncbi:unnamed protein product [Larinioides sclopetarius]|uniref:Uncharacterized protein n=1 Tax=Larinioides sclopetarius TaxID=280406 RepID=A0AAV1ZP65_9ARAC